MRQQWGLHVQRVVIVYILLVRCLQILALAVGSVVVCAGSDAAAGLFEAGERAARSGDSLKAYLLYAQAAKLDPANPVYAARRTALQGAALAKPVQLGPDPRQSDAAQPAAAEDA